MPKLRAAKVKGSTVMADKSNFSVFPWLTNSPTFKIIGVFMSIELFWRPQREERGGAYCGGSPPIASSADAEPSVSEH